MQNEIKKHDPLHGVTLAMMLEYLVEEYSFEGLGEIIRINCFLNNPSIIYSLKFLRKTPWARQKVEELYLETIRENMDLL